MITLPTLNKREKIILVVSLRFAFFVLYAHRGYRPNSIKLRAVKKESGDLKNKITTLNFEFADLDEMRAQLVQEKNIYKEAETKLRGKEDKLFSRAQLGSLLRKITQSAASHNLDFISITPQKSPEGELYTRFPVELKLSSPYSGFLKYLKELEGISDILKVRRLDISMDKKVSINPVVLIELSTVLSDRPPSRKAKKVISISSSAQPFLPPDVVVKKTDTALSGVRLNGILSKGEEPTAIINNQVVGIGSKIGKRSVLEIHEDSVILQEGEARYTLTIER